jgi:CheY-like chemotaxis protein
MLSSLVLVVEDVPEQRARYCAVLDAAGFRTRAAATGAEALTEFAALLPLAVVVLGDALEDMRASQVLEGLRRVHGPPAPPVVLLTEGSSGPPLEGVLVVLAKPVRGEELIQAVRACSSPMDPEPPPTVRSRRP